MEKRIIELEKKIAFQDHEIVKLSEVSIEHQKKIVELEKLVLQLKEQQEGSLVKDVENEELPPHY